MKREHTSIRIFHSKVKLLICSILTILLSLSVQAQTDTEFWFAAPEVDSTHADSSILRFASINPVTITVSIPANPSFTPITFFLAANTDTLIDWNRIGPGLVNYKNAIENTALDQPVNKGIHIVATDKIEAYYEVKTLPNSEVFALKGSNAVGRTFYVSMQNYWYNKYQKLSDGDANLEWGTQDSLPLPWAANDFQDNVATNSWSAFDIVATEDNTQIEIIPSNPIVSSTSVLDRYGNVTNGVFHVKGTAYTITLNKGQTYSARQVYKAPSKSLGGTRVTVLNPTGHDIAITTKEDGLIAWNRENSPVYLNPTDNNQTNLYEWNNYAFDIIGDQLIPLDLIGNEYIVMRGGVYPDQDLNPNTPPNLHDFDGERVFLTTTKSGTIFTIRSYRNDGTLINTYTSQTLDSAKVYAYNFKYSSNKNDIEQFLRITSNGSNFYTYHVSGQLSELGSGIIPTISGCTGSTQLAFTRSYNGLFQVNLMVRNIVSTATSSFKVFDSKGNDVSATFNIKASDFKPIPNSEWSVYTQPNNDWSNKATLGQTYIIKNTVDVFHLGILNISEFNIIDTTRIPTFVSWLGGNKPATFRGYQTSGTIPTEVIETIWNNPLWTKTKLSSSPADRIDYQLIYGDTTLNVTFFKNNSRGAFYGYFSDFNKFTPFAEVPDANNPKCLGDTIQLKAAGGVTYKWVENSGNLKFIDPETAQNPRVLPLKTGKYTLQVQIKGFCSKDTTYTFVFNVVTTPTPTISGPTTACTGSTATYLVSVADTNGFAAATKTWTVDGGVILSGQGTEKIEVQWASNGTHSVIVSVQNKACSSGTSPAYSVVVNEMPKADFSYDNPICSDNINPLPIFANGASGGVFSAIPSGLVFINSYTGQVDLSASTPGTYTVTNSILATGGCAATSAEAEITIRPVPTVTVPSPIIVCNKATVPVTNITSNVSGTISWSISNPAIGLAANGTGQVPSFRAINVTNVPILATVTITPPSNGCTPKSNQYTITVNPSPVVADKFLKVCELSSKSVTMNSSGGTKPMGNSTWTLISGSSVTYGSADSTLSVTANNTTGTTSFRYILTDNLGCTDTANLTVQNIALPSVTVNTGSICQNQALSLTANITGVNNPKPLWSSTPVTPAIIPPAQITATTVNLITTTAGTYNVQILVTDSIGCTATANAAVNIYPEPVAAVSPATNTHICQDAPLTITGQTYPNVVTYKWEGDISSISPNDRITTFKSSVIGNHDLRFIVITDHACTDTIPYRVIVDQNPVFTLGADVEVCAGISKKLPVNVTGGSGDYTYDWRDDNGPFTLPHDESPTYVQTIPGPHNVYLKVIDNVTSCSSSDAMIVTINSNPVVKPINASVCAGTDLVIDGNPTSGSGVWTLHQWTGANVSSLVLNQTTQSPTFRSSNSGPHYLHYKVTDSKGCIGENDATVNVYELPKPVITGKPLVQVCAGASLPLTVTPSNTNSYVWAGTGSSYLDNKNIQNPTFSTTAAGNYTLTVTSIDGNTCKGYDVITVNVNALPTPVVANDSLCAGDSKQLKGDASFESYQWSGDVSLLESTQLKTPNPTFSTTTTTTAGNYNLVYTVTDKNGCTNSIPVTVKVNPLPAANAGPDQGFASGDHVQLDGAPVGAQYSYAWSPAASLQNATIRNPMTVALTATMTFALTVTDVVTQCKNIDYVKVVDTTGSLMVTIEATPPEICVGDTSHIAISVKGGKRPYLFEWSSAYEQKYESGDIRVRPSVTTTYTVTVHDQNVAQEIASVIVTVNQLPTITIPNYELCANDTVLIDPTIKTPAGTTIKSYLWTGAGTPGLHGVTDKEDVSFYLSSQGNYPLILETTNSKGCKNTGNTTVTVHELPIVNIQGDKPEICAGKTVNLTVNKTAGAAIDTYTWSDVPSGSLSSISGATNSYTSTVSGTVYLSVVDANGCKGNTTYNVTVNQNPAILIADTQICQNQELLLDGKPSGGSGTYSTHLWNGTDVAKLTPQNKQAVDFKTNVSGVYSVTYNVTDSKGCIATKPIQVTINALPSVTYQPELMEVCAGSPLEITADPQPIASIVTNRWIEPNKPLQGNSTKVTFKSPTSGTAEIAYQVETNKGCSIIDTLEITVKSKPTIVINPENLVVCENEINPISSSYSGGTNKPLSFSWKTNPENPSVLSSYNTQNTEFRKLEMGSVDVSLIYVDQNTCSDTDKVTIQVNPNPVVTITEDSLHACQGQKMQIEVNPTSLTQRTYTWIGGTGLKYLSKTTGSDPEFLSSVVGKYSLIYKIEENNFGCETIDTILVNVTPTPSKININEARCQGADLQLDASAMNAATYSWLGTNTLVLSSANIAKPIFNTSEGGSYAFLIVGTSAEACSDTSNAVVNITNNPVITGVPESDSTYYKQPYQFTPTVTPATDVVYSWTPVDSFYVANIKNAQTLPRKTDLTNITFTVKETLSGLSCSTQVNSKLYVRKRMVPNFNPDPVCSGDSVLLKGSVAGGDSVIYEWTTKDGVTHIGPIFNIPMDDTTIVTLKVRDKYDTVSVTKENPVYPLPPVIDTTINKCAGEITNITLPGKGTETITWYGEGHQKLIEESNNSYQFVTKYNDATGHYQLYAVTKNAYGCTDTSTVDITVNENPKVLLVDTVHVIPGQPTKITIGNSTKYEYRWEPKDLFVTDTTGTVTTKNITRDTVVTVTIIDRITGCKTDTSIVIVVDSAIKVNINPVVICKGESAKIEATTQYSKIAKPTFTWTDDHGTVLQQGTNSTLSFKPLITTTVTVSVTDGTSSATDVATVTVNPLPDSLNVSEKVCIGDLWPLNVEIAGAESYSWTGKNLASLSSSTIYNPIFTASQAGVSDYIVTVKNSYGCQSNTKVKVETIARPSINLPNEIYVYKNQSYTFDLGASSANENYTWTPTSFFVDDKIKNAVTQPITAATTATLTVVETVSGKQCSSTDETEFKLNAPLVIQLNVPPVCNGMVSTMNIDIKGGDANKYSFKWSIDGKVTSDSTLSYEYKSVKSGKIPVSVTVTDSYDTKIMNTYIDVFSKPELKIIPDLHTYIIGQGYHPLKAVVEKGTGTAPFDYYWKAESGVSLNGVFGDKTEFSIKNEKTYFIRSVVVDTNNCRDTVFVNPKAINPPLWPNQFCQGSFYDFYLDAAENLKWVVTINGDTTESIGISHTISFTQPGVGHIELYDLNDLNNPIYSYSFTINAKPYVDFKYTPDTGIYIGENVSFTNLSVLDINGLPKPNDLIFFWDFVGDNVFTSEEINPNYSYDDIGNYVVHLIGVDTTTQCRDTATKTLVVTPNPVCGLKFPNAFTPDAKQDNVFKSGYIEGIKDSGYNLRIFNRWGQLLYETNSKTDTWDGYYKNELCKQDVYVYHCKAVCENGKELFINGDVTLIK